MNIIELGNPKFVSRMSKKYKNLSPCILELLIRIRSHLIFGRVTFRINGENKMVNCGCALYCNNKKIFVDTVF